jgi:pyruvate/2-oxoglutarate dehydrogenase complex dihydrolipoamide acyltransferase (E2) component
MPSIALWRTEERVVTTMTEVEASVREFKMPDVGEGLTEAEILKWYVQVGDTVTDGQVVCEVETAKAAVELPIPYDGVVRELRFPEGTTVDVGTSIIAVDVSGGGAAPAPAETPAEPVLRRAPGGGGEAGGGPHPGAGGLRSLHVRHEAPPAQGRGDPGPGGVGGGGGPGGAERPRDRGPVAESVRPARWPSRRCGSWRRTWASTWRR